MMFKRLKKNHSIFDFNIECENIDKKQLTLYACIDLVSLIANHLHSCKD